MPLLQITLGRQSIITNSPDKVFYLVGYLQLPNPFPETTLINLIGRACTISWGRGSQQLVSTTSAELPGWSTRPRDMIRRFPVTKWNTQYQRSFMRQKQPIYLLKFPHTHIWIDKGAYPRFCHNEGGGKGLIYLVSPATTLTIFRPLKQLIKPR